MDTGGKKDSHENDADKEWTKVKNIFLETLEYKI